MTGRDPRAVARDQAVRTIRALEAHVQAAVEQALTEVADGFAVEVSASIDPAVLAALWEEHIEPVLTALQEAYERGWAATARRLTPDPPVTVPGLVDDYLRQARNRLVLVGDDMWAKARTTLADGVAAGDSVAQLRQRLRDTFAAGGTQLGQTRAERIARTEVIGAWNRASLDSVRALPAGHQPRYKTWLATLDRRTRADHWDADGQVVAVDGRFTVGGEMMDGPGDLTASAEQTVNCRCTLTYSDDPEPMQDEGRQFLTDEEIAALDAERPGRGSNNARTAAAGRVGTQQRAADALGPGASRYNTEAPPMRTQMDAVVSTVAAGGHWTAADVAASADVPLPAVRTYLARAVETGRLRRVERGVYAAAGSEVPWHTPYPFALAFEGVETGDGRLLAENAITWEGDSWPLLWADEMLHGHDGAELAGAIVEWHRMLPRLPGRGALYVDTEPGAAVEDLASREAPIGVSVDLDDVSFEIRARTHDEDGDGPVAEVIVASASLLPTADGWRIRTREAADLVAAAVEVTGLTASTLSGLTAAAGDGDDPTAELLYQESSGDVLMRVTRARARGATVLALPAFSDARIVLGDGPLEASADTPEGKGVGLAAAVTGDVDLPILDSRSHSWDGQAAASRVLEWAQSGDPDDTELARRLSRAFLWRDDNANPATLSGYSLGVADVVAGELHIIPRGVFTAAGSRGVDALTGVGEDDRERLRARVCGLYGRLAELFDDDTLVCPWRRDDAGGDLEAAAGEGSAMLALIPADPDALAVDGGDPASELHVTLAFLGDATDLTDEALQVAREAAERVAGDFRPVDSRVAGVGTLGDEDPPATVLLLNGADMNRLRERVWSWLGDYGWETFHEQHEPWIPHLTVGYGVDPAAVNPPEGIRFSAVRLAVGGDVTDFPLAAGHDEDQGMSDLEASAWRQLDQLPPLPAGWFQEPSEQELPLDGGPVHYRGGRIWGWVAQRGVKHESLGVVAPIDDVDLSTFLRAKRKLDDGTTVKVGALAMNVGHHRDGAECETSACQFDDTRTVAGIVTVGTNKRGMWFAGAAAPWLSEWDREVFATCAPSGHWRQLPSGRWSLRAVLAVPFPGYPTRLAASGVVDRANHALAGQKNPTLTADLTVDVRPAIRWDHVEDGAGAGLQLLAAAVVDEMERRDAARQEAEELRALMARVEADLLATTIQGDQ